jgi:hypothetical protein
LAIGTSHQWKVLRRGAGEVFGISVGTDRVKKLGSATKSQGDEYPTYSKKKKV